MKRVEEFTLEGHSFAYIDLSGLKSSEELVETIEAIKPVIANYPPNSLYTITNIANFRIDSDNKETMTAYLAHNKRYVKRGAVVGMDGVKKIMADFVFKISGRTDMIFAFSKEKAIELLLKKE